MQHGYAMLVVIVGWVFFRSADLHAATAFLGAMMGAQATAPLYTSSALFMDAAAWIGLVVGAVAALPRHPVAVAPLCASRLWARCSISHC